MEGQDLFVTAGPVTIVIKHNDTGISLDYWNNNGSEDEQENPFKSDQIWFDDLETEDDERGI